MPRHKMAEGHKGVYPVRVRVCMRVCVFQNRVRLITSCMEGFKNYLAQMIIKTKCVACKNRFPRSKVKVAVGTQSFCVLQSCPTHNFIMHSRISNFFCANDYCEKTMCCV